MHIVAKQGQYEYFIDDLITLNNSDEIIGFTSTDRANGNIQFLITETKINSLRNGFSTVGSTPNLVSKFNALSNQPTNQSLVGLAYQVTAVEFTNLTNSNDHVKFTRYRNGNANEIIITMESGTDLSDFIIDREVILSIGSSNALTGGAQNFINRIVAAGTDPSDYIVCTVSDVSTANREITLTNSSGGSGNSFDVTPTSTAGNHLVGFKNTFLIAKGRILV